MARMEMKNTHTKLSKPGVQPHMLNPTIRDVILLLHMHTHTHTHTHCMARKRNFLVRPALRLSCGIANSGKQDSPKRHRNYNGKYDELQGFKQIRPNYDDNPKRPWKYYAIAT